MAKRHARVKLSRAQKLERELNHWLAKKDSAIATLCKAMVKLKELERSRVRMQKTAQLPAAAAPVEHPRVEAKETAVADALVEDAPVPTKPRRRRKPDPASGEAQAGAAVRHLMGAVNAAALGIAEAAPSPETRAARMKALGFRPSSKRASKPAG